MTRIVVAVIVALSSVARAGAPTVAVMPFRDLSGSPGALGEAIRETVTTDLKEVPGLRVIERGNIDRVIAEQNLAAQRSDLTPISAVRVGTLLGATLMATGAYQRAGGRVRLTARFVNVESGEIVGTAKVDGDARDFLALQDKVTAALLKGAGMSGKPVERFVQRKRPRLKSLAPVEKYGQAVVATDDAKKKEILEQVVAEAPEFTYAARDLDELEKRLKDYDAQAERSGRDEAAALEKQVAGERDPTKRLDLYKKLFEGLAAQHRYRRIRTDARAALGKSPSRDLAEEALGDAIDADHHLFDESALLSDGEEFLRRFPTSKDYKIVRQLLDDAIAHRRKCERQTAELPKLLTEAGGDRCKRADAEDGACKYQEARADFLVCVKGREHDQGAAIPLMRLVWMNIHLNDWKAADRALHDLEATKSHWYREMLDGMEEQEAWPLPVEE